MNYNRAFTMSATITPHDTNPIAFDVQAIYVGGAGNITLKLPGDAVDLVLTAVPVGVTLFIAPTHIRAAGTTATLLKALG